MKTFDEWAAEWIKNYPKYCQKHPFIERTMTVADIWEIRPWMIEIDHYIAEPGNNALRALDVLDPDGAEETIYLLELVARIIANWKTCIEAYNWDIDGNPQESQK